MARGGKRSGAGRKDNLPSETGDYEVGNKKPPKEHQFKPGNKEGGRPASAGLSIQEQINGLQGKDERYIRRVAKDAKAPWNQRTAANRMLRTIELGDMSDFEPILLGHKDLAQLRAEGINTEVVKKMKRKSKMTADGEQEFEREIELHDRAGEDFDRIFDRTVGKPNQAVELTGNMTYSPAPVNKLALPAHLADKMAK